MQSTTRIGVITIMVLLLVLPLLSACNGGNGTKTPISTTTTPTPTPTEKITVTIGNHTDKTGVASNAMGILEIIKSAAEVVGPENLDSQAIYGAAQQNSQRMVGKSQG